MNPIFLNLNLLKRIERRITIKIKKGKAQTIVTADF